jgi:hypothetical protein
VVKLPYIIKEKNMLAMILIAVNSILILIQLFVFDQQIKMGNYGWALFSLGFIVLSGGIIYSQVQTLMG